MQVFIIFFHILLLRLVNSQSTPSQTAYVGLVPDYPNYDTDSSGVDIAIDNTTTAPPPRDPCGPLNQPLPSPAGNTCNVSIIESQTPAPYGVQCLADHSRIHLDFGACSTETIPAICAKLADPAVQNATWIWASANAPNVCYMGFYLPPYDGSAQKPDEVKCVEGIFRPMLGYCNPATGYETTEGMYNLGMVNIKVRPDESQTGQAVDAGYPSYIMATSQLTA